MTAGRRLLCRPRRPRRPLLHPPCGVTAFDRGGPHCQPSRRGGTNVDESASGRPLSQTTPPSQTVQPRADASRARCPPQGGHRHRPAPVGPALHTVWAAEPHGATEQGRGRRHWGGRAVDHVIAQPLATTLTPRSSHSRTASGPRWRAFDTIWSRLTPSTSVPVSAVPVSAHSRPGAIRTTGCQFHCLARRGGFRASRTRGQRPRSRSSGPRHIQQRPPSLRPGRLPTGSVAFGSEPSRAPLPTRALLALTEPHQPHH
jgi:hypothetical protein